MNAAKRKAYVAAAKKAATAAVASKTRFVCACPETIWGKPSTNVWCSTCKTLFVATPSKRAGK